MSIKRSFSLVEVLVSVVLFSLALTFVMPPLQSASKMMFEERATVEAQSAVEEAVHQFHVTLLQHENLSLETFQESMQPKEVDGFTITFAIAGTLAAQDGGGRVAQLMIDVMASKEKEMKPLATRRIYLCVTAV